MARTSPSNSSEKIYEDEGLQDKIVDAVDQAAWQRETDKPDDDSKRHVEELKKMFHEDVTEQIIETAAQKYGQDLSERAQKKLRDKINAQTDTEIDHAFGLYQTERRSIDADRNTELEAAASEEEAASINETYDKKQEEAAKAFKEKMNETVNNMMEEAGKTAVRDVETAKREKEKRTIEDSIKDHLRGFSRTIPSFLMAYGDDETTLQTFDVIIPDQVFYDVTSITTDNFRFLRDGGDYKNPETGETEHFDGNLFDPIVFNDSVKEFLGLKVRLANYFDELTKEDIFDYIPPQKTNQIFTPRPTVKDMVDRLEQENPGCYDDPDKTFVDMYMKSGMYITEIVKRLYNSERMKRLFPDDTERLNHIFAKQVYGLAPTEIIYRICMAYIMGFSNEIEIKKYNIRLCDALEYAKAGTLDEKLRELFPELKGK